MFTIDQKLHILELSEDPRDKFLELIQEDIHEFLLFCKNTQSIEGIQEVYSTLKINTTILLLINNKQDILFTIDSYNPKKQEDRDKIFIEIFKEYFPKKGLEILEKYGVILWKDQQLKSIKFSPIS